MKDKLRPFFTIAYWKPKLKTALGFLLNPRFVLCFGIAWFLTNGWCYVAVGLGTWLKLPWLAGVGTAWMAALWFPFTPEKIVTVLIAMWLLKRLFPNDQKTLAVLHRLHARFRAQHQAWKAQRAEKKAQLSDLDQSQQEPSQAQEEVDQVGEAVGDDKPRHAPAGQQEEEQDHVQ